jgi:hypothetical protein
VTFALTAHPGHAELRVRRLLAFVIGVSVASNLITDLPVYRSQFAEYATWWSYPAVAGQILGAATLLLVPWFSRGPVLRLVCFAYGVVGLVAIALLVPAAGVGGLPDAEGAAWSLRVQSTYAMPVVLALTARYAWGYIAVMAVASGVARTLTPETQNLRQTLEDTIVNTTTTVLLSILVLLLVRIGRELDVAADSAIAAVRRDSAAEARAIERRRVELLAHDEILHTLRVVGMGVRSPTTTPASLAATSLERLGALDGGRASELNPNLDPDLTPDLDAADLPADEFLRRLRAVVTAIAPLAAFEADDLGDLFVPADAATALLDASGEALRNSIAHASEGEDHVARTVRVRCEDGTLTVSIADDGRGFRPREVPARRLGVARSIVARMQAVPGGGASVDSAPGSGTRVALTWR